MLLIHEINPAVLPSSRAKIVKMPKLRAKASRDFFEEFANTGPLMNDLKGLECKLTPSKLQHSCAREPEQAASGL
jgi:hypothetical protein